MRFLSILLFFAGYTFVYAAVAKRGVLASEPWLALFTDAYAPDPTNQFDTPGGGTGTFKPPTNLGKNPVRPRTSPGGVFDVPGGGTAPFQPPTSIP